MVPSNSFGIHGYFPSKAPFQCIHDVCSVELGQFLNKGNTDTGPTNHISGVNRAVIEPFWTSGLNTFDTFYS